MASISKFACDADGLCTWLNPGKPTNPLLLTVSDADGDIADWRIPATATSCQIPAGMWKVGETVTLERITVQNTFTTTIPAPPAPPAPTGVAVSITPSLPASVLQGTSLQVAFTEGFADPSQGGVPLGSEQAMFGPNYSASQDPMYPFNSDERAVFARKNATILSGGGLDLECAYTPGVGKSVPNAPTTCNYTSAAACTLYADPTAGGAPGFNMRGYKLLPQAGVDTVFEVDLTIPPYFTGFDGGLIWLQGAKGIGEIDEGELMDEVVNSPGQSAMEFNIINHATGSSSPVELQVFNDTWLKQGGRAKLTTVIYGISSIAVYLTLAGGTPVLLGTAKFPADWAVTEPMAIVISFGLRDIEADENPTWQDTKHVQVWSVAVTTTDVTKGHFNGGVAAGTIPTP